MGPIAAVRPDPEPRGFAERAKLDQSGVARAAEVLGILLDGDALDLRDASARVVGAYLLGATERRQSPRERAALAEAQRRTIQHRTGSRLS